MQKILLCVSLIVRLFIPTIQALAEDTTGKSSSSNQKVIETQGVSAQMPSESQETPAGLDRKEKKMTKEEDIQEAIEQTARKIVKAVEVQGNKTISISVIISKIKMRVGQEYLQNVISDDIKRLYNTGYFSDVRVDRKDYQGGFKVIFYLTEKPIVEEMTFSKTRHFNSRAILIKMKTKKGKFLDQKSLKEDIKTIQEMYAKKGLTSATVDVKTSVDEAANKARLNFTIKEGQRTQIRKLDIIGNKSFPDKKILKVIKTRAHSLFTSGYLKEDVLKEDMDRIKSFYNQNGFINAEASYTLEERQKGRLAANIQIDEGQRYYMGGITVNGNKILTTQEILDAMKATKAGNIFSREKLEEDISNIRTVYFDKGYIFAEIKESTSLSPETGRVQLRLDINEGQLAYVDQVKIQGNTRTRDIVVRREVRLYPGDQFDGVKLRRTKERLKNLGYFEDVSYDIEDTQYPDRKDLIVQVKEAKTGSLSFGGGYSSIDKIIGFVEIEQKNFDFTRWPTFTGGGQHLSLRAETGSVRNDIRLSFTEPWIFDYPISGGFDAYRLERDRERDVGYAYDEKRVGGDIRFGKEISEYLSAGVTYRREKITIGNLETGVSADLAKEAGQNTLSDMGFTLTRDTRDSVFNPTKGLLLTGTFDAAGGVLGGDKDFVRFQDKASLDVPFKHESVLELSVRMGFADAYGDSDGVPIFERFFAGGARSIRGYDERKVGPIDPVTEDPLGGESLLVANVEYTIPLIDFIKLAAFFDTGNVWARLDDFGSGNLKSGAGLGFRVKTPIGPINLDYGYPLNEEPGEEKRSGKFYFSVSRGF